MNYSFPAVLLPFVCLATALAGTQERVEPRIPFDAIWTMPIERVQTLPDLERTPDGSLKASYTIRSNSQVELVARWQGRAVSLFFGRDFGLYAVRVELIPWAEQHSPTAADAELRDLQYGAPIRVAVITKYGLPQGTVHAWDAPSVTPFPSRRSQPYVPRKTDVVNWQYARSWLIWEGATTRLALGEQALWYLSQKGLAHRAQLGQDQKTDRLTDRERDRKRRLQRQSRLDRARRAVPSQARAVESFF